MKRVGIVVCLAMLVLGLTVPAVKAADEIENQIKQGLKLYQQGKYNEAVDELEFAVAQLRQRRPPPFPVFSPRRQKDGRPKSPSLIPFPGP